MNKLSFLPACFLLLTFLYSASQQPVSKVQKAGREERFRTLTRPQVLPQRLLQLQLTYVPDLTGREYNREQLLPELEKLRLTIGDVLEEPDNSKIGKIIRQEPAPLSNVFYWTKINLVIGVQAQVETGNRVKVPGVIGFEIFQAKQILSASRLMPGEIVEIPANQQQQIVVRQFPAEGSFVSPGSLVKLYVSSGQGAARVYVPDLIGKSLEQAAEVLKSNNLVFGSLKESFSEETEGIVVSQSPIPGTQVGPGAAIDLIYTVKKLVPDLIGRQLEDAVMLLRIVDIPVGKVTDRKSPGEPGTILDQSLPAGSEVRPGTEMDLVKSIPVPPESVPIWIFYGAGLVVILAGTGFIIRKVRTTRKKKQPDTAGKYQLKAVPDKGEQKFEGPDKKLLSFSLRIKPDKGTQIIEN
jgi:beta-lactam-binding protein with PASTA domain